jgi:hypothetical protein
MTNLATIIYLCQESNNITSFMMFDAEVKLKLMQYELSEKNADALWFLLLECVCVCLFVTNKLQLHIFSLSLLSQFL